MILNTPGQIEGDLTRTYTSLQIPLEEHLDNVEKKIHWDMDRVSKGTSGEVEDRDRSILSHACLNDDPTNVQETESDLFKFRVDVLQKLLKWYGDDVAQKKAANGRDVDQQTRLHEAVRAGNLAAVKVLREKAASANAQDILGRTPLFFVVDPTKCVSNADEPARKNDRRLAIAGFLLQKMPADEFPPDKLINTVDREGKTALDKAVSSANVELVKLFVVNYWAGNRLIDKLKLISYHFQTISEMCQTICSMHITCSAPRCIAMTGCGGWWQSESESGLEVQCSGRDEVVWKWWVDVFSMCFCPRIRQATN